MLGAIIGDIVGSRFEFNNHRSKDFDLFGPGCFATDDSIMTLAVAKAIMEAEREAQPSISGYEFEGEYSQTLGERTVQCMQSVGRPYPHCGYGGMFAKWMYNDHPKPYNSFGNGAAMRISPVGFAARTEWDVRDWSEAVTAVTHSHPEGIKGAEATAMAIFMARQGCLKSEIRERIVRDYYPLDFTIDQIRSTYRFNETCQETVPQAIECFLESTSFEDAIRTAISLGGDSDTLAAITGAIAEAYYDVPQAIRELALTYLDERLRAIFDEWEAFLGEGPEQFHVLTKYIGRIEAETAFFDEFYQFNESHPQYQMNNYHETFAQHGLTWDADSMRRADVSQLAAKVVLALLMGAVRADRINEGALRGFFRDGSIRKWLTRLKDIDRRTGSGKLAEISLNIGGFLVGITPISCCLSTARRCS
jgi:ADP-ribosylglycohydrolase